MKTLLSLALVLFSKGLYAQEISMEHFPWKLRDVKESGLTKEKLFSEMDREFINLGQSICANRALMWLHDMKRKHDVDAGKIFLFYTAKKNRTSRLTWWYHVAPIINESGKEWVLDAGFGASIKAPVSIGKWLHTFVGTDRCYEITPADHDLIQMMREGRQFPMTTHRGNYDCYYAKAPAGYWFPTSLADGLTGRLIRDEIEQGEVYEACKEAITNPIGRFLQLGNKKCKKYLKD